jgi:putative ABC transport system permease protein
MRYFELTPSNDFEEKTSSFTVRRVMEIAELKTERALAPQFPGLTDVDRCSEWDIGMPMDEEQLEDEANEAYWEEYKQTPKAIISLAAGQRLWANRFGALTSVRWDRADAKEEFEKAFNPAAAGFVFQPVREQALASVNEAMDFGQLFIGMSFFLIIATLMLTGLLFVFGVQQRAEEMGTLLALGWASAKVRALFLMEGGVIALVGSAVGAWAGIGYTKFLIWGLSRYWQGAIANSAIQYFAKPETVVVGAVAGFLCALTAMAIAMWRQAKHPARELLQSDFSQELKSGSVTSKRSVRRGARPRRCDR